LVDLNQITIVAVAILVAGIIGVRSRISSSIFEVFAGVLIANVVGMALPSWLDLFGTFGGLVLTFLAGAEVEFVLLKSKAKESLAIGTMAFAAPLLGIFLFLTLATDWTFHARLAGSLALTTTSVAVVFAVLTEYGIIKVPFARTIIAVTFVNDILTLIGVNFISPSFNLFSLLFLLTLVALVPTVPRLLRVVVRTYGKKAIEVELRFMMAILLIVAYLADEVNLHAVFGAFVLGLIFANSIQGYQDVLSKMRVVTFTLLAPFFFVRAGMLIALPAVIANAVLVFELLGAKLLSKFVGTYALSRKWIPEAPMFSTMLFSTGLTVGTIVATLGLNLGFLSETQFSVVVTAVILSAVIPTLIAKKFIPSKF
jgi:Kef-type K+ transport system membrane component KefB